jgi:hypothetical protein
VKVVAIGIALALTLAACGYHVAGHTDTIPKTIHTVCIPAFANRTTRYKLTDRMPEAIAQEFNARTRYHVVSDCTHADAELKGSINDYRYNPTVFDPTTGRASAVDVHVYLTINFVDRTTNKVLFNRSNMEVHERYEISVDAAAYVDESDAALNRAAKTVAQQMVTAILSNF